jgi:hypothetical protein
VELTIYVDAIVELVDSGLLKNIGNINHEILRLESRKNEVLFLR